MNFVGIIAEYDPFHSGHALQLRMLRQRGASTIAVCMSTGVVRARWDCSPSCRKLCGCAQRWLPGRSLVVALPAPYAQRPQRRTVCRCRGTSAGRAGVRYPCVRCRNPGARPLAGSGCRAVQCGDSRRRCAASRKAACPLPPPVPQPPRHCRARVLRTCCKRPATFRDRILQGHSAAGGSHAVAAPSCASGRSPWHRPDRPGAGAGAGFGFPYPTVGAYARNQGCQPLCAAGSHGAVPPGRGTRSAGGPGKVQHRSADCCAPKRRSS